MRRLINQWSLIVQAVESGYSDNIYEFENDLGVRQQIKEAIADASELDESLAPLLSELDERFKNVTRPRRKSVFGDPLLDRVPKTAAGELKDDIAKLDL